MNLISCDWGTSRFRLHLMDRKKLTSICSLSSEQGAAALNLAWQKQNELDRLSFFRNYLKTQVDRLSAEYGKDLGGIPITVSGMASSSIGMMELPYAKLPFAIDGSGITQHLIESSDDFLHDIYLISGLASSSDVMRGEETQLIGLQNTLAGKKAHLILPGTHSKHVEVQDNHVVDFSTFMTGELFALTTKQSVLSHSVEPVQIDNQVLFESFTKGVEALSQAGYLQALFKVRTRTLLDQKDNQLNYAFLSGIHLGAELQYLTQLPPDATIIICASPQIAFLYRLALKALGIEQNSYVIPGALAELATSYGHLALATQLGID